MEYWIWLSILPYIGAVSAGKLISVLKSPENVYHSSEEELRKIEGLTTRQRKSILEHRELEEAKRIVKQCEKCKISLLPIEDPLYPERAKNCKDAPIILYYRGTIKRIDKAVGIVGARRCTQETKKVVADLAAAYVEKKTAGISGMAKGVDSYAHTAGLKAGGYTVAVLANGLDICYPNEHQKLKECIENEGLIISEYSPGVRPTKYAFPRRNRLISAWSDELVVVAAGKGSGALITAEYSRQYGRKVRFISEEM